MHIHVRVHRFAGSVVLGALLAAGAGCGGGKVATPDAGGGVDGGPTCSLAPGVVSCDVGALSVGLASPAQAFVAVGNNIMSWDPGSQAWATIFKGDDKPTQALYMWLSVISFDPQGQPIIAYAKADLADLGTVSVARWNGAGWTMLDGAPAGALQVAVDAQ